MTIRVLIADDQQAAREALRLILDGEPDIDVIATAADGAEAVHKVPLHRPDVVVMDLRMPGMDGIAAIDRLAAAGSSPRVLALTTFDLDEYLFGALRAGAAGFLLKDSDPDVLIAAVRALHQGRGLIDPQVTGRLISRFTALSPRPATPELDLLTPREHHVLLLLARGMSNGEIAAACTIEEGTVKTHVNRILTKLGLRSRVHAAIYAHEHGLVARDAP
ncbi:response regulator transcription factor [Nonomuraea fuscirosea]|uniref:response regulator transcription factor n=1 Tax=Nonomuraea fuscirosea TaxID=1291556 RepID=UPI00342B0375